MATLKIITGTAAMLLFGSSLALAAGAGDADRGKELANTCSACHGMDGTGMATGDFSRLNILTADYMNKQLLDFKSGERESPVMKPFAEMLDEQQMRDVSAWFASQSASPPPPDKADDTLMEHGEKLAMRGDWNRYIPACHSCHGPDNQGVGDSFPALAGQHAGYIESQLRAWREGTRKNDPQQLMLAVAERMDDADIKAVAAWLAAQPANGGDTP